MYVIFIGSVCLRGDYLNIMFIVMAMDENNQTLLLAIGLAVENNLCYCTWFLMRPNECLGQGKEVSFITNMEDAVSSCVNHVLFDSYHGYTSKSVFMYILT